jgi:hypothetical protein
VLTHGFIFPYTSPDWLWPMAADIRQRDGGSRDAGNAIALDFDTGRFTQTLSPGAAAPVLAPRGQTTVVFDWAIKSNNTDTDVLGSYTEPGWREAAADFLANFLLGTGLAKAAQDAGAPIHFIGHSFGTVVISQAIRRLVSQGIRVQHMTTLDPHDFDQDDVSDVRDRAEHGRADHPWDEPPVRVWEGVDFADNYWQDNEGSPTDPYDGNDPFDPVGHPIAGAYNEDLTARVAGGVLAGSVDLGPDPHSRTHEWYHQTIMGNPDPGGAGPEDEFTPPWYRFPADNPTTTGYAWSAGPAFVRPPAGSARAPVEQAPGVFNGDFTFYQSDFVTRDLPGYDDAHDPHVVATGDAHGYAARLDYFPDLKDAEFTHRPIYLPEGTNYLTFDYNVRANNADDVLIVGVPGGPELQRVPLERQAPGWRSAVIRLPSSLPRWLPLEFKVTDPTFAGAGGSTVWVDKVNLSSGAPKAGTPDVNGGAAQRSTVRSITVPFDRPDVTWDEGAFRLVRRGDGVAATVAAAQAAPGGRSVALLTFGGPGTSAGSLADGVWDLTVDATKIHDADGRTPSADVTFSVHRLFGDYDGDGRVNAVDWARFARAYARPRVEPALLDAFDSNGDRRVNALDYAQFRRRLLARPAAVVPPVAAAAPAASPVRTRPASRELFGSTPVLP